MNILESYDITSPAGKTEVCAKFVIDDVTTPFKLASITKADQQYTFSFWIKSDAAGSIYAGGKGFASTSTWTRYIHTFSATAVDFFMSFLTTGTYYIYHPQLEIGNMSTDYTQAPEDTEDSINNTSNELHQAITNQNGEITANYEAAILAALENYNTTGDFEEFKTTVENALTSMEEDIVNNQTSTTDRINSMEVELLNKYSHLDNWIHIDTESGSMTFGSSENKLTLTIDNDEIVFKKNGEPFGRWDGVDFHTGNIYVEVNKRAQFGNFAFIPRSDGSLSFLKVGD